LIPAEELEISDDGAFFGLQATAGAALEEYVAKRRPFGGVANQIFEGNLARLGIAVVQKREDLGDGERVRREGGRRAWVLTSRNCPSIAMSTVTGSVTPL